LAREKKRPRLGDIAALVRASRSAHSGQNAGDAGALARDDALSRKRRLVAGFCRLLGDQFSAGKRPSAGQTPLAPRQRQTLELLLEGKSEKEIANQFAISRHTVHVYVKLLYKRFGVSSRAELLARWVQRA
jgi:DNA-binding CsgD family transcriptional regulator